MNTATEILLVAHSSSDVDVNQLGIFLSELKYMWMVQEKSQGLGQIPPCQIIIFKAGPDLETDLKILRGLRSQVAYLPIIIMGSETLNIPPALAQLSNSILHSPATLTALERKILRHLEPREGHHVRVFGRADAQLKVVWRQDRGSSPRESKTVNISRGGTFIREGHFYPNRGDIVDLTIRGDRMVMASKAIVRWISSPGSASNNTPGFGVEFLSLTRSGEQLFESLGLR